MLNLTTIANDNSWHLASTIKAITEFGVSRRDAEAFAAFLFADRAKDGDPEGEVTDEQWNRLEWTNNSWILSS